MAAWPDYCAGSSTQNLTLLSCTSVVLVLP